MLYLIPACGHCMAALAFILSGDYTAASTQLFGAAVWIAFALPR